MSGVDMMENCDTQLYPNVVCKCVETDLDGLTLTVDDNWRCVDVAPCWHLNPDRYSHWWDHHRARVCQLVAVIYSAFGQGKNEDQEIILCVVQFFSRQCSASANPYHSLSWNLRQEETLHENYRHSQYPFNFQTFELSRAVVLWLSCQHAVGRFSLR